LLFSRILTAVGVSALPERVRDVAIECAVGCADVTDAGWIDEIAEGCRRLGLSASAVDMSPANVVAGVGPGQPVVTVFRDGDTIRAVLLLAVEGRRVRVETVGEDTPRWLSIADLATLLRSTPDGRTRWLVVDAPLADVTRDEHPTPRARLWSWMRLERHDLLTVLVYAVFVGLLGLTTPVAIQALVNTVAFGTLLQPLVVLSLLLLGALTFSATLRGLQYWVVEVLQRRIFVRVVNDLSRRLPRARRDALDGHDGAELANRFFDVVTVQKAASSLLLDGLEIILTVGVGMIVLAFYHPLLFAFDLVLIVAVFVVALLGRGGPRTAIVESKQKYKIAAWLEELGRHDLAFKLGGGIEYAEIRADALTQSWLDARKAHFSIVLRQFVLVLTLQALAGASILGIGGWLVVERQLTLGQLVAAELIVTVVVASVAKLGKHLETYYDLLASLDKLGQLFDLPTERSGGARGTARSGGGIERGGIELLAEALTAGYTNGPDVLHGASFRLSPGSRTALVGADGSGKSLLVELVAALREPGSGRIAVDGWDTRSLDLGALRERIAVVRTAAIVPGTVLENVRMGRAKIGLQEARDALHQVGLLDAVDRLPAGLETLLSATGEPLSPGERARIVVARAIASEPGLLVIDDALDGLQPTLRREVFDMLCAPTRQWTLLVVSDDPILHERCDQVLLIDRGVVHDDDRRPSLLPEGRR